MTRTDTMTRTADTTADADTTFTSFLADMLFVPTLLLMALLGLLLPALSHAAPATNTVFVDTPSSSDVRRIEVRAVPNGSEVQVEFTVRVAPRSAPRLRAEWTANEGWESLELTSAGNGVFRGTVSLPVGADLSFFLLGANGEGQINDVRYGTLFSPVRIPARS